jgi:ATP-dependent helicase/nuclease subunit A
MNRVPKTNRKTATTAKLRRLNMAEAAPAIAPAPDQHERIRGLDSTRSVLVRASAGSGKTDLLTRRFLRLLAEVDDPGAIVAITFTRAAAAEMRHRILEELERAADRTTGEVSAGDISMAALAARALRRSAERGWNLLELSAQLRISTIDSFCREIALQRPLLSGLGGAIEIADQPRELYRRAARRTLQAIETGDAPLRAALEALLLWRDNGWQEIEEQLIAMLHQRDRWMHDFVVSAAEAWELRRERLERPFRTAIAKVLVELNCLLDHAPGAREEILALSRFACSNLGTGRFRALAELAELPEAPFATTEEMETAREACCCLCDFLQTQKGEWRSEKGLNATIGFPATDAGRAAKKRLAALVADLDQVEGLRDALSSVCNLPPPRYTEGDWRIVQACFLLLLRAAAELQVVFAESGAADYVEVAQIADSILKGETDFPGESTLSLVDKIRHLLVDEFQDTSRRQHFLLSRLIAAWPEREGRTCFVVGDPMQSIYFFRDADAELFPRVEKFGLEIPGDLPFQFESVPLSANFRTAPALVSTLNETFAKVFAADDGSGVKYTAAEPAREAAGALELFSGAPPGPRLQLHLDFVPATGYRTVSASSIVGEKERVREERKAARNRQVAEIVSLIGPHLQSMHAARAENLRIDNEKEKTRHRIAVLGRTRKVLEPIAAALRTAQIPFRAVDLEPLRDRPEVLDALALTRALLNPQDRVAWLGVLRAPWCALSLEDLHRLVSADDPALRERAVPDLLAERLNLLRAEPRAAVARVLAAFEWARRRRSAQPSAALGAWIEQAWLALGGAHCVDAAGRANLDLFWRALDALPAGEEDLLGPALDAALEKLTALPDPEADENCGVQLMTIHKAKGLEFEVVIVPEMQAGPGRSDAPLLSWLERGLAEPDESGEPTEFLVAPIAAKGADISPTRAWVDRARRDRERQELRRLLYVAASRAREQLHFFARPAYRTAKDGSLAIVEPRESLLATGWPALAAEIRRRFEAWRAPGAAGVVAIAAAAEDAQPVNSTPRGTRLRRLLPDAFEPLPSAVTQSSSPAISGLGRLYPRHEGGLRARAFGVAVHTLLEEIARLRESFDWDAVRSALPRFTAAIVAQIRSAGVDPSEAARMAARAVEIVLQCTREPNGVWILSPHTDAQSEVRWAGFAAGSLRTVQVDRIFRAGTAPGADGDGVWWIVDYKTAHEEGLSPHVALPKLREEFAPQLEAYSDFLRKMHGADATVRAGLYYPRLSALDWWEI